MKDSDNKVDLSRLFENKKTSNEKELQNLVATFENTLLFMDDLKKQITLLSTKTNIEDVENKSKFMKDMKWKLHKQVESLNRELLTKYLILDSSRYDIQMEKLILHRGFLTPLFPRDNIISRINKFSIEEIIKEKKLNPFPYKTCTLEDFALEPLKYMRSL